MRTTVAGEKVGTLFLVGEKRGDRGGVAPRAFGFSSYRGASGVDRVQPIGKLRRRKRIGRRRYQRDGKRRPDGDKDLRLVWSDDLIVGELETLGEHPDEGVIEGQRSALKDHRRFDLQPLGETADRLPRYGVERGESQIGPIDPLVEERLDVGLRENAAPSRDLVEVTSQRREIVELLDRSLEQFGDLVDERAGSAGAAAVHPHIRRLEFSRGGVGMKKDHLRVLTAEFYRDAGGGMELPDRYAVGDDFLHVGEFYRFSDPATPASGEDRLEARVRYTLSEVADQSNGGFFLPRAVAEVAVVENVLRFIIDKGEFDRGRADIDPE